MRIWLSLLLLLLTLGPGAAEAPPAPLRGVALLARWSYRTPVTFVRDGQERAVSSGYLLGLEVNPLAFAGQGGPPPLIFVGRTPAVLVAGPLGPAARPLVVVLIPEVDLSSEQVWLGPRARPGELHPEEVARLLSQARARGAGLRLRGAVLPGILRAPAEALDVATRHATRPH